MSTNNVVITRKGSNFEKKSRSQVAYGHVFSYMKKDGTVKPRKFLAFGSTTVGSYARHFSVKLQDNGMGELASATIEKGRKTVAVIGKFAVRIRKFKSKGDEFKSFRSQLKIGDVYFVNEGGKEYVHMGRLNDTRYFALNSGSLDYATTDNDKKAVTVIGVANFEAEVI